VNLAIVGYGKMGRMVERLAPEYGFAVTAVIDEADNAAGAGLTAERLAGAGAAIEFSTPHAAAANLLRLAELRVPTVCGTTGWFARLEEVRAAVERNGAALVWSANFSVGVNVFLRVVAEAARSIAHQPDYAAWGWEIHHSAKQDAPSGTLLRLVEELRRAGYQRPVDVSSNRAGAHPGTHEIGFDSSADTLTFRHVARSREGFARGALQAARWVAGRTGCWEFSEILFGEMRD
jgi:4-hydroxy-tetrahydrodipicolinate reductase